MMPDRRADPPHYGLAHRPRDGTLDRVVASQRHERFSNGVHPRVVLEVLRHSQSAMTMDTYSHVMPTLTR